MAPSMPAPAALHGTARGPGLVVAGCADCPCIWGTGGSCANMLPAGGLLSGRRWPEAVALGLGDSPAHRLAPATLLLKAEEAPVPILGESARKGSSGSMGFMSVRAHGRECASGY
eukprot:355266-Chlamydomonas_euryale.AAC.1